MWSRRFSACTILPTDLTKHAGKVYNLVYMSAFEIWRDRTTGVTFYFSHSDEQFTTGVMEIPPHTELPKHNRPKAFENLVQVSGVCVVTVFDEGESSKTHILHVGDTLRMEKGQHHIHANTSDVVSCTLFKAEGDITQIMDVLRENFERIT